MTSAAAVQGVSAPHRGDKSRWSITVGSVASQGPVHWHREITTAGSPVDLRSDNMAQQTQALADALLQGTKWVQHIRSG